MAPLAPAPPDFYATWCHGCQKAYPELCKLAREPAINKQFKFAKVRAAGGAGAGGAAE
jgi:thioredoxin-like negative regulator of GroEL